MVYYRHFLVPCLTYLRAFFNRFRACGNGVMHCALSGLYRIFQPRIQQGRLFRYLITLIIRSSIAGWRPGPRQQLNEQKRF